MARRIHRAVLPSTQDEAIGRARAGAGEGTLVVADSQFGGRGRGSNSWASPEGGLYLSMVTRALDVRSNLMPIAVGVALADALQRRFEVSPQIKWPNDLLVPRSRAPPQKLGGVLVDRIVSPTLGEAFVVGIGINVHTPRTAFPLALRDRVAILSELTRDPVQPGDVEPLVVASIDQAAALLRTPEGPRAVVERCRARLYGRGRPARVDGLLSGTIEDIGEDGVLWLDQDGARVEIRSGAVAVDEAP
ncbi:MAG: biotin--[acetyl-CoA-carboxylase] ligase [Thermoplasmata archaeon]|nr:biotin--[acetyl-CoA-carboxylase] ligase [Thermoplasmata archaeon]